MLFAAAASGALVRLRICVAWDAQPEVDMASLSLRMRDVIMRLRTIGTGCSTRTR